MEKSTIIFSNPIFGPMCSKAFLKVKAGELSSHTHAQKIKSQPVSLSSASSVREAKMKNMISRATQFITKSAEMTTTV